MALNLHGIVAGVIDALNPRFTGVWRRSSGFTTNTDGVQVPAYTNTTVLMRVQALSAKDLRHENFLNVEGVKRVVTMFGLPQGVNKPDQLGGDLLQFPETRGGVNKDWKIVAVLESWAPDTAGWGRVGVVLQGAAT